MNSYIERLMEIGNYDEHSAVQICLQGSKYEVQNKSLKDKILAWEHVVNKLKGYEVELEEFKPFFFISDNDLVEGMKKELGL